MEALSQYSRPDEALVARLRARDESAVADLDAIYRSRIQQLALRYVKNPEDAEEVAQDVLLKVYRKIDAFRGDAALSSWIYRITFNTVMSRLRGQKTMQRYEVREQDLLADVEENGGRVRREPADWSSLGDEAVLRSQLRTKLAVALKDMPEIYRTPVILRDMHGLSTEEASSRLGIKEQTLKSRLHRGRLFLRDRLAEFATGLSLHRQMTERSFA
ncbi:MAG: sigma-70 family RNA polymerase sigma factor [Acidobacteria bacterium]|nr:sigma-70 family RNA polymerase sigma factor [Acidobacteriota bacterium]